MPPDYINDVTLNPVSILVFIGFLNPVTKTEISVFGAISVATLPEIVNVST